MGLPPVLPELAIAGRFLEDGANGFAREISP